MEVKLDIPENAKYVILTLKIGENTIIYFDYSIPITIASLIADLEQTKNRKISNNNLENLSVSTDKLQDSSVTPNKTTFFEKGGKKIYLTLMTLIYYRENIQDEIIYHQQIQDI